MVISKKANGKKENNNEVAIQALNFYKEYEKHENDYLKADEVKGKSFSDLLAICQKENKWHIALVRKIVSAFGGEAYQKSLDDMNAYIESIE